MKLRCMPLLVALLPIAGACTVNEISDGGTDSGTDAGSGTGTDSATKVDGGSGTDGGTGANADAGAATDSGGDAQTGVLGFTPSNIDLTGLDLSKVGDVIVSGGNNGILDTEQLGWTCCTQNKDYVAKTITF